MPTPARLADPETLPAPLGSLGELARRQPGALASVLTLLCEAEVALSPEDELELDALVRQVGDAAHRGGMSASPLHALSFWLMKRRAGQVGERLGRELLAPAVTALGDRAPRVHLIGHSFGAKLVTSAVLGGVRPDTLVLLQAAFSAFAFAEEVPGTKRPGFYRPVLAERMVAGPIVALRSDHDRALGPLYPAVTWGRQVERTAPNPAAAPACARSSRAARWARWACSAWARRRSTWSRRRRPASRGACSPSTAPASSPGPSGSSAPTATSTTTRSRTLVLLAAGLLRGGPAGPRPVPSRHSPRS